MALLNHAAVRSVRALALAAALAAAVAAPRAGAQERPELERQVKAAYLYKFGAYVSWPESASGRHDAPLVIGVAGADLLADELGRMVAGRSISDRPLTVRRVTRGEAAAGVHILFVGAGAGARAAELIEAAKGRPVLVVGEFEANWPPGCVINFVAVDNRVRFDVALDAAEQNGLKVSAQLLSVARQVKGR
jgi:hypothetical protein